MHLAEHVCITYGHGTAAETWRFTNKNGKSATVRPSGPLRVNNCAAKSGRRDDFTSSECARKRHPQRAAQAACSARGTFSLVEIAEDLPRPFEKHPAGAGRRNVPRSAQKQLQTQPRLEACHHPRYRRLRHPELARDAGE